jgi:hypothetical protein
LRVAGRRGRRGATTRPAALLDTLQLLQDRRQEAGERPQDPKGQPWVDTGALSLLTDLDCQCQGLRVLLLLLPLLAGLCLLCLLCLLLGLCLLCLGLGRGVLW